MQYIRNPNAIILSVTSANTDLANSDDIKMAREVSWWFTYMLNIIKQRCHRIVSMLHMLLELSALLVHKLITTTILWCVANVMFDNDAATSCTAVKLHIY
jgi:hypothetical protein